MLKSVLSDVTRPSNCIHINEDGDVIEVKSEGYLPRMLCNGCAIRSVGNRYYAASIVDSKIKKIIPERRLSGESHEATMMRLVHDYRAIAAKTNFAKHSQRSKKLF